MTKPKTVLIGPPGAGKTTIGRLLAKRLGTAFRDTDLDVEETAGKPVSEIFIDDGEERFRELEHDAVRKALTEHDGILALGGGAIMDASTRRYLAGHTVVYLKVGLADAIQRVGLAQARPLLVLNPRSQLRKLMAERAPIYEELATFIADTDGRPPEDIAAEILKELGR